MLSMTYLCAGEREFGLELGRRCQQNIALEQGMTWDGPNVVRGNTGERGFGNDYYQNMIMWAYPAALAWIPTDRSPPKCSASKAAIFSGVFAELR